MIVLQTKICLPLFGSGSFGVFLEEKCLGPLGVKRGARSEQRMSGTRVPMESVLCKGDKGRQSGVRTLS